MAAQISFDGIGEPINYPENRRDNTYQISDNLAWTAGKNQFNIGADLRRVQIGNYLDFLARGDWFFQGQTMAGILNLFGQSASPCIGAPLSRRIPALTPALHPWPVAARRSRLRHRRQRQHLQRPAAATASAPTCRTISTSSRAFCSTSACATSSTARRSRRTTTSVFRISFPAPNPAAHSLPSSHLAGTNGIPAPPTTRPAGTLPRALESPGGP